MGACLSASSGHSSGRLEGGASETGGSKWSPDSSGKSMGSRGFDSREGSRHSRGESTRDGRDPRVMAMLAMGKAAERTALINASALRHVPSEDGALAAGQIKSPAPTTFFSACTIQGEKQVNQDTYLVVDGLGEMRDVALVGVWDGHGQDGCRLSSLARDSLHVELAQFVDELPARVMAAQSPNGLQFGSGRLGANMMWVGEKQSKSFPSPRHNCAPASDSDSQNSSIRSASGTGNFDVAAAQVVAACDDKPQRQRDDSHGEGSNESGRSDDGLPQEDRELLCWGAGWRERLVDACLSADAALRVNGDVDVVHSGSTCIAAMLRRDQLVVLSVGDSVCLMGTERPGGGGYAAVQLSIAFKPEVEEERARIVRSGGRVFAHPLEPHVSRVWLPQGGMNGLAMSRAFGDENMKTVGVTATPGIVSRTLTPADRFLVLCSDGVGDSLTNEEIVDFVGEQLLLPRGADEVAKKLVALAMESWHNRFGWVKRDDMAAVVLFFGNRRSGESTSGNSDTGLSYGPSAA